MKLFVRSLCLAALCTLAFAQGDNLNFKFTFKLTQRQDYATLDKLSESLLTDPYVLVEIGVRKSQMAMLPFRERSSRLFTVMNAAQAQSAETTEDGAALAADALKNFHAPIGLTLSDLDGRQRSKLQKVALSRRPMEALLTKEVHFALTITPEQQKRLETIRNEFWTRCSKIEDKHTDNTQLLKLMKSYGKLDMDSLTAAQRMAMVEDLLGKYSVLTAKAAAAIEEPIAQATKDANQRALRVLTPSQATQFKRLQSR